MSGTISSNEAMSTSAFIGSIGINVHLASYNTAYANLPQVISDLQYLGIDLVRDCVPVTTDQAYWTTFETAMAAGLKFDMAIPEGDLDITSDLTVLNALQAADPNDIVAVEGLDPANWPNTLGSLTGETAGNAFQIELNAAVHSDPQLSGVQVYNYTLNSYNSNDFTEFGNISSEADYGNAQIFPGYWHPEAILSWFLPLQLEGTPNDPFVITETGYDTMPGEDTDGSQGVNDDVQAKYTLDDIFDFIKAGASKVYLYELLDEFADPNDTDHEQHFGLFNNNETPKEAAIALHNLTTILADPGATAATFTPGTLAYGITNLPDPGNSFLLEKSNGSFDLAIWDEPEIWNPTTLQEISVPATTVTVTFGLVAGTVEVFDPLYGTSPIATYSDVTQIAVAITDHPLIIEIDPVPVPTLSGVRATQTGSGTISPFATLQIADAAAQDSATVALSSTTHGALGNLGTGTYSAQTGLYSVSGTPAQVAAAVQDLTFTPIGDSTTTLTLAVTNNEGSNSSITSVSDAAPLAEPALTGVPAMQSAAASVTPFANLRLSDAAAEDGASVVLSTTSQGSLSNLGIGSFNAATGSYRVAGTPAEVAAALQQLVFTPSAGSAMAYTTKFTLTVSNQVGTSGTVTSVTGSRPLPAPDLSGVPTTQTASGTITPFDNLQISDLTLYEGASILLSNGALGTFGNLGIGSSSPATGAYSVSGTPANVAAALQQVTFTPAAGDPIVSLVTFNLSVSSATGTRGTSTTVDEINQSQLPVPTGYTTNVALWTGSATALPVPVAGDYNEALVSAPASGAQIVAPRGFQAVLLAGTTAVKLTDAGQGGVALVANQGSDTLQAGATGDVLIGGSGSDAYVVSGGDTVTAGSGTTTISSTGDNTLQLGAGTASVTSSGGDTVIGGAGAATISAGTGDAIRAGSGTLTFIGGTGTTTVFDSTGSVLITAPTDLTVSASGATISAAAGGAQKIVLAGSDSRTVSLGAGTETLDASGSSGAEVLVAGSGIDQITGGSGLTQFDFVNGHAGGTVTISGFSAAKDTLVLSGYGNNAVAAALQSAHTSGGSTVLQLGDGTNVTLSGVTGATASWLSTTLH
jgi:Ca2+-binding RTX toxin-like protein